ncbi:MAG: DUF4301 family protein [Prevotella sp.]|nr:DUF4301 family protein [Prevotella sp.]
MTLQENDLRQIAQRGIAEEQVERQIKQIKQGFPFLKLEGPASIGQGIAAPTARERADYIEAWKRYKDAGHTVVKFVPASGAASRMFKDMFAFLDAPYESPQTDFEKEFFEHIRQFAFRKALCAKCHENDDKSVCKLLEADDYKSVVRNMLTEKGLNYGQLPKGLLLFHNYDDGPRTPMEEHLVEAALYASSGGQANVHFTVSHDHLRLFKELVAEKAPQYAERYGVKFNVTFSEQKPSTDTIAANPDGTPFRNDDGSLLFRPGGHGALIENLNEIEADVVFIKNIDNVVPDRLKAETVEYKQLLAGMLVVLQARAFDYLRLLDKGGLTRNQLEEIHQFVEQDLYCHCPDAAQMTDADLAALLRHKLNRPMRVCGMVKNVGEPGGGPFRTVNSDGSVSLQILESSQIDKSNTEYVRMFTEGTHFNPVDLVCATRDYLGKPFNLPDFVDPQTGFVSQKSKNGRDLLALELPGLWNGAMSDWNTVFVEVPLGTFNPVKTVNDLLREQHQ